MVQLRRQQKGGELPSPLTFVLGLVVGFVIAYTIAMQSSVSESSLLNLSSEETTLPSKTRGADRGLLANQQEDGWHQINVFYGKKSGLGADPNKKSYAQVNQDRVVLDLIGKDGFFIDLAANDALDLTNTLLLEKYGWNGLCIEPNPNYWYGLSHRKCTVVGALVGGNTMQQVDVKFRGVYGGIVGKMDQRMANFKKEPDAATEKRFTAPFGQILAKYKVPKVIDYVSLDVEGAEYLVMQNFPFDSYRIRLMTIERPTADLKKLLNANGYYQLKELVWWGETLWAHESEGLTPSSPSILAIPVEKKN